MLSKKFNNKNTLKKYKKYKYNQILSKINGGGNHLAQPLQQNIIRVKYNDIKTLNGHSNIVNSVSFSRDGEYVVSGSNDKSVKIWSSESGEVVRTLNGHTENIFSVSFSPDGKYVVSGSRDKSVKIWSTESGEVVRTLGEVVRTLNGHTDDVWSVSFSPDGKYVVSGSDDKSVKIWSTESGEVVRTLNGHTNTVGVFLLALAVNTLSLVLMTKA